MKSNISTNFAPSSHNVSAKNAGLRPDGKKKKSMTDLVNKVSRLVNIKQNSMLNVVVGNEESSSDDTYYDSNNSEDSLMEKALENMKMPTSD